MKKEVFSFRLDKETVEKAKKMGVHLPDVIQEALNRITFTRECPTCGARIKKDGVK